MKQYNEIKKFDLDHIGQHILATDKIDGSNFRVEWNRKLSKKSRFTKGFKKFGTRNRVITNARDQFFEMVEIFDEKYTDKIDERFRTHKIFRNIDTITLYGEFYGENSFGGFHNWSEPHDLYFFDIWLYKKDFLSPSEFYSEFRDLSIPRLIYKGPLTEEFIQEVQENKYNLREGVVYKFVQDKKITIGKIKTLDWLQKVKDNYGVAKMLEY
jgi:hypothetical protein